MDVSIVSGTYNRLEYLQRMVQSVRQSVASVYGLSYEIVLVDGGSTDGTIDWCKSQPDIKLIEHGALHGAVKAFNDGAYAATGKYVIMANDDIEFISDSIPVAYVYMETHLRCGGGCFYQNRNNRDWHVEVMPAVTQDRKQVHIPYAQVGIFPKWLGDKVGWWCKEENFIVHGFTEGLHTYGGDNELSAMVTDLGFEVSPVPGAKISDSEADDELRKINNIEGGKDPKAVQGHHPDSWKWGKRWLRRNERIGWRDLAGPIIKNEPQIQRPTEEKKERVLYLPIYEPGWQVQKEQKRGLRNALASVALVTEYDYMDRHTHVGKEAMMAEIYEMCKQFQPTVFLSQLHNDDIINATDINNIRQVCEGSTHFANWNGDYWPDQLLNADGLSLAKTFDIMTVVNRDVQEKHQQKGINCHYWQIGWEPEGRNHEPEEYHDIVFLASGYSPSRQRLGQFLRQTQYTVGLYGNGWPEGTSKGENLYNFREACKIYRGAKLAIGDSQWPESGFVSNRIMQILAAGNCVLCHQWFRGIDLLGLYDGENCVIWENLTDLGQKLSFWLSDSNSQKLRQIALNGENLALERHSFESRVTELWEMLGIGVKESDEWDWR